VAAQQRVLVAAQTSKFLCLAFQPTGIVYSHTTVVFGIEDYGSFAVLNSTFHSGWIARYCASLETRLRYLPTDGFETFPFPMSISGLVDAGRRFHDLRQQIMLARHEGLTKTYNRFHDRGEQSDNIARLRTLHAEMDRSVAIAYGWVDLDLGHGFHETKQGVRYTISEAARRAVLDRLLALNHQRYAEEVKAGLHDKKAPRAKPSERVARSPIGVQKLTDSPQFGLELAPRTATDRFQPTGLRFPISDPALYAVNLVVAILSEAGGSLAWQHLRDAFVLVTRPDLMKAFACADDARRVEVWTRVWNETATPSSFLPCLRALFPKNILIRQHGDEFIFQLADGVKSAASEDVGYDAWLGLRVSVALNGKAVPLPEGELWFDQIREMVAA
jgi:hypothetical protein